MQSNILPLPQRPSKSPSFSSISQPLKVISNHLPITVCKNQSISLYSLTIEPEVPADARGKIRWLFNQIRPSLEKEIGKAKLSGWLVFAIHKKLDPLVFHTVDRNKQEYMLSLSHKKEFQLETLRNETNEAPQVLQSINVIFKEAMRDLNMVEMGRTKKFFYADKKNTFVIKDYGIEILTGFHTNTLILQAGPRLLVDYFSRIVWQGTALEALNDFRGSEKELKDYYIGTSVMAEYGNHRNYRIVDIDFKKSPIKEKLETTIHGERRELNLLEYYKIKYDLTIRDGNQPLILTTIAINVNGKRKEQNIYLIPELCKMTGLNELKEDRQVMKEIAPFTKLSPAERTKKANQHILALNKQLEVNGSELQIGSSPTIDAYQLNAPKITFDKTVVDPDKGLFDMRSKYGNAFGLAKWLFIYTTNDKQMNEFIDELRKQATQLGFNLTKPRFLKIEKYNSAEDFIAQIGTILKPDITGVQMVTALFYPDESKKLYKPFKQFCSEERSLPSQVVLTKTISDPKKVSTVCKKIILQIYAKMGFSIWRTESVDLNSKKVMLIGADVYHNTRDKRQSVIGFCSSLDSEFSKYFSRIRVQEKKGEEIMRSISNLIREAIEQYEKFNKFLPELIIFYRDGVGQGQIDDVRNIEISNILASFKEIKENYAPEFVEIVVTKRINDRFYVYNKNKEIVNPPSGTLVNESVVSNYFDFFLCAQNVTQGTCTPTHYNVIYNTSKLKEDQIERITYFQCFNYFNWMGAIRVPACAKYADLLAYSVGQILVKEPNEELCRKLYYL